MSSFIDTEDTFTHQVLLTRHEQLSPGVSEIVGAFLGGQDYYRPSALFPQSVTVAVQQGFRFPVWPAPAVFKLTQLLHLPVH